VPPLSVPDVRQLPDLKALSQYEAVSLFIERAKSAKVDFEVTDESAPAFAEICVRLDGLPLAIELAAARIKMLPPKAILERLTSRLKLLTGGARDLPERQRTLRATIEWSHALLDEGEQLLFGRLAVFSGGRTLEAIGAVWCEPIFPDSAHSQLLTFRAFMASNSTGGRYPRLECNLFSL
jgi:predicted ATPase